MAVAIDYLCNLVLKKDKWRSGECLSEAQSGNVSLIESAFGGKADIDRRCCDVCDRGLMALAVAVVAVVVAAAGA